MGGVQAQFQKLAVFVQASIVPSSSRFLLNDQPLGFVEAGIRYNFADHAKPCGETCQGAEVGARYPLPRYPFPLPVTRERDT